MTTSFLKKMGYTWLRWLAILVPISAAIGSTCAFFLWSLNIVTQCRFDHPSLLYFLPLAGLGMGLIYHHIGKNAEGGNNLILEKIHQMGGGVPRRMAPLILLATLVTHLFGGSAGREGTAVQMGGSMASAWGEALQLHQKEMRILLISGIAAGFGAVFGTPFAGAIFSIEVLMVGHIYDEALLPALIAAIGGDFFCRIWGVKHLIYELHTAVYQMERGVMHFDFFLLLKTILIGIAAGLVSRFFVKAEHALHGSLKKMTSYKPVWPLIGGTLLIGLVFLLGTKSYLGLGVWSPNPNDITIATLFHGVNKEQGAWFWKLLFTAITLAAGFKGGEVTPLFFIGAALGNLLAVVLGGPSDLFTAFGFVALFAGASNTPLACTIMGAEIFGAGHLFEMGIVSFASFLCSSRQGIYHAQHVSGSKKYRTLLRRKTF